MISDLALRYQRVVFLIVALMMATGLASYFTLPAREDPAILIREAVVTAHHPSLSPERMEELITRPLEEAVRGLPELKAIRSLTQPGTTILHVEIQDRFFELDDIWSDLRERLSAQGVQLPPGTLGPYVNDDFGDVAVVVAALRSPGASNAELDRLSAYLRDGLYTVEGTSRVDVLGLQTDEITIEWDAGRIAELGLSLPGLVGSLRAQNVVGYAGTIDTDGQATRLVASGEFRSLEDIENLLVRSADGGSTYPLGELATIERHEVRPSRQETWVDGEQVVMLAVTMQSGMRVLDYGPMVLEKLDELESTLPVGTFIDLVSYQPDPVETAVHGVTSSVLQTLGIVLGIVILFLGLRGGIIVGAIVPAVMLITLAVMGFTGMPLERISLATLVIALGLLVDNGIVVAEDFKRRLQDGDDRDAALRATGRELALPLLSSTFTTILVFLPLMLAQHSSGEYTRSISLVILISLTTSWLLSMTVTPVLCYHFMPVPDPNGVRRRDPFELLEGIYANVLRTTIRFRWAFGLLMVGLLMVAGWGMSQVPARFFPDSDRPEVLVYFDLPADATTDATRDAIQQFQAIVGDESRFPEVEQTAAYVGFGGPRFALSLTPIDPAPNRGFAVLTVADAATLPSTVDTLRRTLAVEMPDVRANVGPMFLGPSDSAMLQLQVSGPDAQRIYEAARALEARLLEDPDVVYVRNDWEGRVRTMHVEVDQRLAARAGLTSDEISAQLDQYFDGLRVTEFREHERTVPILARGEDHDAREQSAIESIPLVRGDGLPPVPLRSVATITYHNEFARIGRDGLERAITIDVRNARISAEEYALTLGDVLSDIEATLPAGYSVGFDGVVADSAEGQEALAANVPLCLGVMIVLLVLQFNSFRRPMLVLSTIPLLIIGAALGLHTVGAPFGFMVILGLYSLAGIIINNAIVLIDRIDIELDAGADPLDGVISASTRRLRPILMATVTTVLGLLPLILSQDALFFGMASVIAFGLVVGTVLTLGVVPVLYTVLFRIPRRGPRPPDRDRAPGPVTPAEDNA